MSALFRGISGGVAASREDWLNQAVAYLAEDFQKAGHPIAAIRVTVGFPSVGGLAKKSRRLGECWPASASASGARHIFISPLLAGTEIPGVLVHELCHAATTDRGHGKAFRLVAKSVGLEGAKPKHARELGEPLIERFAEIIAEIGGPPVDVLDPQLLDRKVQKTRMLKLTCGCGRIIRTTAKALALPAQDPDAPNYGDDSAIICGLCEEPFKQENA